MVDENNQEITRSEKFKAVSKSGKHKFLILFLIVFVVAFAMTVALKNNIFNKDAVNSDKITNDISKHITNNYQKYLTQQGINENVLSKKYISDIVDVEIDNIYNHNDLKISNAQVQPIINKAIKSENSSSAFKIPENLYINNYITDTVTKGVNDYVNTNQNRELLSKFHVAKQYLSVSLIASAILIGLILIYSIFKGCFIHLLKWSLLFTSFMLFAVYFMSNVINNAINTYNEVALEYVSSTHIDSFYNDLCFGGLVTLIVSLLIFAMHKLVKP